MWVLSFLSTQLKLRPHSNSQKIKERANKHSVNVKKTFKQFNYNSS